MYTARGIGAAHAGLLAARVESSPTDPQRRKGWELWFK